MIIDTNPSGTTCVDSADPILRYFVEPGRKTEVRTFKPSPFMTRLMARSAGLEFENLLERTVGDMPEAAAVLFAAQSVFAATVANGGFEAELALPVGSPKRVRLALVVVDPHGQDEDVYSLAGRNYPLNPSTYAEVELN